MDDTSRKGLTYAAIVVAGAVVGYFVGNSGTSGLKSEVASLSGQLQEQ